MAQVWKVWSLCDVCPHTSAFASFFFFVTVDITVFHNGYHGDLNETFFVGEVDEGAKRLVQTTYECLMQAIDAGAVCFTVVLCIVTSIPDHSSSGTNGTD